LYTEWLDKELERTEKAKQEKEERTNRERYREKRRSTQEYLREQEIQDAADRVTWKRWRNLDNDSVYFGPGYHPILEHGRWEQVG
jgi:hypothetical protein